ncbi:protein of unknown function [Hyphomicrobium sp. MC1]|nr:protein of unknown function [Hyphomicrobium sp. MC1]
MSANADLRTDLGGDTLFSKVLQPCRAVGGV